MNNLNVQKIYFPIKMCHIKPRVPIIEIYLFYCVLFCTRYHLDASKYPNNYNLYEDTGDQIMCERKNPMRNIFFQ